MAKFDRVFHTIIFKKIDINVKSKSRALTVCMFSLFFEFYFIKIRILILTLSFFLLFQYFTALILPLKYILYNLFYILILPILKNPTFELICQISQHFLGNFPLKRIFINHLYFGFYQMHLYIRSVYIDRQF